MGNVLVKPSSLAFLGDFKVEKVTVQKTDVKGKKEATVVLADPYDGYTMNIQLVKGKKEGDCSIKRDDGTPYMKIKFVKNECEGEVTRTDQHNEVELKGTVEKGKEVGLWTEYEFGRKKWEGFYRNGKRYSTITQHEEMSEMFVEKNEDGQLLSISGYDENWRKNGKCYEYEKGELKRECIYEHGRMKRVVRVFTANGLMIVYSEKGKRLYKGEYHGDVENGFNRYPRKKGMKGFYEKKNKKGVVVSVSQYDENGLLKDGICYDYQKGELGFESIYKKDRFIRKLREWEDDEMIEYRENGTEVYEGGFGGDLVSGLVRQGEGTEYREDGTKLYTGKWKNNLREGFGKEFGGDGKNAVYVGEWEDGMRYGYGSEYDGDVAVYSGEWKKGKRDGYGKEMNEKGKPIYEGMLKNELRDGYGKEMDENGNEIYGRWREGVLIEPIQPPGDGPSPPTSGGENSILAIDFGSSNSVSYLMKNGHKEQISDSAFQGVIGFPSLVEYLGDTILTSVPVKNRKRKGESKYCVSCVKRILGLTWEQYDALEMKEIFGCEVVRGDDGYPRFVVSGEGKTVSPIEVATELFRKIKEDADKRNGAPVVNCYVTVPANYKENQRGAIKTAAEKAGFNVKAIIIEPTAAAMSWCLDHEEDVCQDDYMLVFDFGGGTLDLSLLKYDGNGEFSVIDTDGDPSLGGFDVDKAVLNHVCNILSINFDDLRDRKKAKLLASCEDAKIGLSSQRSTELDLNDITGSDCTWTFTRADLSQIINQLFFPRISACLNRLMNKPGRHSDMIKKVFMVGGSSRLLAVQEEMNKRFPEAKFTEINPEESVAEGAVLISQIPGKIHDIIVYSYGLSISDNDIVILLPRGTRIPCESEPLHFSSAEDYPDDIHSTIYQWNGTDSCATRDIKPIKECSKVQEYFFKNDNPLPKGQVFTIAFRLEFGGTLEVTCKDDQGNIMNRRIFDCLIQTGIC